MSITINAKRLHKIKTIMKAVLDKPEGDRAAFLARACVYDYELLKQVEIMLLAETLIAETQPERKTSRSLAPGALRKSVRTLQPPTISNPVVINPTPPPVPKPISNPVVKPAPKPVLRESPQPVSNPVAKPAPKPVMRELPPLTPGVLMGGFELIRDLGRGCLGPVWLAYDQRLELQAMLQMLPPQLTRDVERVRRFQRDARAVNALHHRNILNIYAMGEAQGRRFIAAELIAGRPLRRLIGQPELNLRKTLEIAGQTASALLSAHHAGVVHNSITPENILIQSDGAVKVLGFGLARLTAAGDQLEPQSDLLCLGLVLYEMLAGRRPIARVTYQHMMAAIQAQGLPPLPLQTPPEIQCIVNRALARDPDERYQTAKEMLVDLLEARDALIIGKSASVQQRLRKMFT